MWHDPVYCLPLDGITVWVRRAGWWSHPALATWSASSLDFTLIGTTDPLPPGQVPNSNPIPWTLISAWRPQ